MNHRMVATWPSTNHYPIANSWEVHPAHGIVSELAGNFRQHLTVLSVDTEEILVFQCNPTARVTVSRIRRKIVLKKFIPTKGCEIYKLHDLSSPTKCEPKADQPPR
jgi:hypothetical protein